VPSHIRLVVNNDTKPKPLPIAQVFQREYFGRACELHAVWFAEPPPMKLTHQLLKLLREAGEHGFIFYHQEEGVSYLFFQNTISPTRVRRTLAVVGFDVGLMVVQIPEDLLVATLRTEHCPGTQCERKRA
jgi:hypothetical protein